MPVQHLRNKSVNTKFQLNFNRKTGFLVALQYAAVQKRSSIKEIDAFTTRL